MSKIEKLSVDVKPSLFRIEKLSVCAFTKKSGRLWVHNITQSM